MFRIKIDPRTVMTIQNQIPKIIMALVFVTFSYAIAGFLVDLMYVTIYLFVSIFVQQGADPNAAFAGNPFGAVGGFGGISGIATGVAKSISGIVNSIFDGTLGHAVGAMVGGMLGGFLGGSAGGVLGGLFKTSAIAKNFGVWGAIAGGGISIVANELAGNKILGLLAGIITYLVIVIAIFSALLRLWFVLIKAYIFVLITVVFAPLYIAYGLIPGKSGFGNWVRSLVSNLAAFPAVIVMFLLAQIFTNAFGKGDPGRTPFAPPLVGDFLEPKLFASIIGLGFILLTPEVVKMVQDAIKAPEFKYTTAIGRSLGAGAAFVGSPVGGAWKGLTRVNPTTGAPIGIIPTKLSGWGPWGVRASNFLFGTHK
jgi:hypothetical protein